MSFKKFLSESRTEVKPAKAVDPKHTKKQADEPQPDPNLMRKIPAGVKKAFDEYGFDKKVKLENAIAVRSTSSWFGILFYESKGNSSIPAKTLWAIDFVPSSDGEWEVQNDGIEGFNTVEDFTKGKLSRTFF